jgi:3-dehydroquinate synthase
VIEIPLELGARRYSITVGHGASRLLPDLLGGLAGRPALVVSDRRVWSLHGRRLGPSLRRLGAREPVLLPGGETHKSWQTLGALLGTLMRSGLRRDGLLIAVGGGVVGDVAGLAAALYMRGIDWVVVPTTLLAMVDSAIGGKVGVNHARSKNAAGAFHQPRAVVADPELLATLPDRQLRSGAYEILKCGVIGDRALVRSLVEGPASPRDWSRPALENAIASAIRLKAEVVERDERERDLRRVLNLGHTIGHALEAVTRYRRFTHGEAVGWGLLGAAWLARERGLLSDANCEAITSATDRLGPRPSLAGLSPEPLLAAIARDKKVRTGRLTFVLPTAIGRVRVVEDVERAEARRALRALTAVDRSKRPRTR